MLGPGAFYVLLLVAAGAVTGGLAWYAWRHREEPGARPLAVATSTGSRSSGPR